MAEEERKGTVVVIDDDEAVRALLTKCLQRGGYEHTHEYTNGQEAVDDLQAILAKTEGTPDISVMLVDYMMPEMNGAETIAAIKDAYQERYGHLNFLPEIIIVSGFGADEAVQAAGYPIIMKPIKRQEFVDAINAANTQFYQRTNTRESPD